MAYHETFWIVVGTAAPIIALAAVVALTDQTRTAVDYLEAEVDDDMHRRAMTLVFGGQAFGIITIVTQGLMLLFALLSLAARHDWVPLIVAEITVPLGIVLTLSLGTSSVGLRIFEAAGRKQP